MDFPTSSDYVEFSPSDGLDIKDVHKKLSNAVRGYRRLVSNSEIDDVVIRGGGTDEDVVVSEKALVEEDTSNRQSMESSKLTLLLSQKGTLSKSEAMEVKRLMMSKKLPSISSLPTTTSTTQPPPQPTLTNLISIDEALTRYHGLDSDDVKSSNLEAMLDAKILATSISLPSRPTSATIDGSFTAFSTGRSTDRTTASTNDGGEGIRVISPAASAAMSNHLKLNRLLSSKDLTEDQVTEVKDRMMYHRVYESTNVVGSLVDHTESSEEGENQQSGGGEGNVYTKASSGGKTVRSCHIPIVSAVRMAAFRKGVSSGELFTDGRNSEDALLEQNLEAELGERWTTGGDHERGEVF